MAATLGFALATGPELLALARLTQGAAAGLVWTAGLAAIADVYPVDELGFRLGLAETAGGGDRPARPDPGRGPDRASSAWTTTFALAAILPALALIPVFFIPETRRGPGSRQPLVAGAAAPGRRCPRRGWPSGPLAGVAAVLALLEPLLPLDLADRLDLSSLGIGIVFGAGLISYFAAGAGGRPLVGPARPARAR